MFVFSRSPKQWTPQNISKSLPPDLFFILFNFKYISQSGVSVVVVVVAAAAAQCEWWGLVAEPECSQVRLACESSRWHSPAASRRSSGGCIMTDDWSSEAFTLNKRSAQWWILSSRLKYEGGQNDQVRREYSMRGGVGGLSCIEADLCLSYSYIDVIFFGLLSAYYV